MPERRHNTRLALPDCVVLGTKGTGRILDISSSGVGIEVPTRCVFARGESHRLILSTHSQSVAVEGLVRWTQSGWRDASNPQGSEYYQTAGIAISRLLTSQPKGIWSSLLEGVPRPVEDAAAVELRAAESAPDTKPANKRKVKKARKAAAPKPQRTPKTRTTSPQRKGKTRRTRRASPLKLVEPVNGASVEGTSTQVVFSIQQPHVISGVRINGVEALLRDELGTAEIELHKGTNRIVSIVSRRDGTYSTYVLGKIDRSTTH